MKLFYNLIFLSDKTKSIKITAAVSKKAASRQAGEKNPR
jgi:hypothetical protein